MRITESCSVRADLCGGTLDLPPIDQILNSQTINMALGLKAQVELSNLSNSFEGLEIVSTDYDSTCKFLKKDLIKAFESGDKDIDLGPMEFILRIFYSFNLLEGIKVRLSSGSPPGGGLGGSSSMGITLYKALCEWTLRDFKPLNAINLVRNTESVILNKGPAGYQDYYPACYGGVLNLSSHPEGVEVEQLWTEELSVFFESHMTLVYSGKTRLSGINNWEVYKKFFDHDDRVRNGLTEIRDITRNIYYYLKNGEFENALKAMGEEGKIRTTLWKDISPPEVESLVDSLGESIWGHKMCGAGGGGCFLLFHPENSIKIIHEQISNAKMQFLDFKVSPPVKQ